MNGKQFYKIMKKVGTKVSGRGWTRSGTISEESVVSSNKTSVIKSKDNMTIEEKVIRDLKSEPFKRGVTYKKIAERYNISQARVLKIRKENEL